MTSFVVPPTGVVSAPDNALRRRRLVILGIPAILSIAVTLLGLGLRVEHALTFDGPNRGSDYAAHVQGMQWMMEHMRSFNFTPSVPWSIGYQPPLWYMLGGKILKWTESERAVAFLAVFGWLVRQVLLARIMSQAAPCRRWSALCALSINAVLPLSVLTDGKVNPEGMHTTLFMVAAYGLWRMERDAIGPSGISWRTAAAFGFFSGLAVLTKATAGVLPMAAGLVLLWRVRHSWSRAGWRTTWQKLLRPAVVAMGVWVVVAGWWCAPNIVKYGHPFPHVWDRQEVDVHPELAQPVLYRRPLGWALPFDWKAYLDFPVIRSPTKPRPNLWAVLVTGTWSDWYNRGFCRLRSGTVTRDTWDGNPVTESCTTVYRALLRVGCFLTLATLLATAYVAAIHLRTRGRRGTLAFPLLIVLCVLFSSSFALVYPYDNAAVLNPRYLLPESTLMSACLGIALGQREMSPRMRYVVHGAVAIAIALVAALVILERFGR